MVTAARNSRKWQVEVTPEMEAGACGMVRPLDTHHAPTARMADPAEPLLLVPRNQVRDVAFLLVGWL